MVPADRFRRGFFILFVSRIREESLKSAGVDKLVFLANHQSFLLYLFHEYRMLLGITRA